MGQNIEMTKTQRNTEKMQEGIRQTEWEISETVHEIENRLSPANIKRRAMNQAKQYVLKSVVSVIDMVQRRPLQAALVGTGAVYLLVRKKKAKSAHKTAAEGMTVAGTATRAFLRGAAGKAEAESHSAKRIIWKGIATLLSAALGTAYYRRKPSHTLAEAGHGTELPRAGEYPGMTPV